MMFRVNKYAYCVMASDVSVEYSAPNVYQAFSMDTDIFRGTTRFG